MTEGKPYYLVGNGYVNKRGNGKLHYDYKLVSFPSLKEFHEVQFWLKRVHENCTQSHTYIHLYFYREIRVGGTLCVTLLPEGDAKEDTVGEADLLCKGVVASEDCDLMLLSESPGKVLDSISPPPPPSQVSLSHFFACFDSMILS